jgi:HK97 family phage major capsid protein
MNSATLGLTMSMMDAVGRPMFMQFPSTDGRVGGGFQIVGSPVVVVDQMPDCEAGATPVLFGSLEDLYMVVTRRATTMLAYPYSSGFCTTFKFSSRIGGAVICANAGRLLRIR